MWRVVVARSDENSTLLSSEIGSGPVAPNHISSLSGPPSGHHHHHWGYPPPPHPSYQPQHSDVSSRHHHDPRPPHDLRHPATADLRPQEIRHEMHRPDLRHQSAAEMQRHQPSELHRPEMARHHQDLMRPDMATEIRSSHEFPDLKMDVADIRNQESGQQQQQASQQGQAHQQRSLKRTMSDSDCDDVFSEESGKEPWVNVQYVQPSNQGLIAFFRKGKKASLDRKSKLIVNIICYFSLFCSTQL